MRARRVLFPFSAACVAMAVVAAQSPDEPDWQKAAGGKMAFEVASVRRAAPHTLILPTFFLNLNDAKPPGGRFSGNFQLALYISFAYKLSYFQDLRSQLPKWANAEYVINAKAEGNPTKDQMRLMMQSLLADRFKLKAHFESKEVPVLALSLVKPGKLGPKLIAHSEGPPCPDTFEMITPFTPISPPKEGVAWPPQCGSSFQMGTSDGTWRGARNITMGSLADTMYDPRFGVDKPVVDQTGLKGTFDFILELPAGIISLFPKPPNPDDPPKEALFRDALRKQLGLKLVQSRGEIRMLVIDHIEKPSENE